MTTKIPEGEFYAHLYVKRGAPVDDGPIFRRRLAAFFGHYIYKSQVTDIEPYVRHIMVETGANPFFSHPYYLPQFDRFFESAPLIDVLTAITIIWRELDRVNLLGPIMPKEWRAFIERLLREENVGYRIDSKGGIHPVVDQEFARNQTSVLAALTNPRYATVLHAAEAAFKQLEALPMDGKGAARNIFEAAESLTKIITGTGADLDEGFVNKDLRRIVDRVFDGDEQIKSTANRLLSSFGKWVSAVHPFRHGHDRERPLMLPDDVAVLAISQGASFLRWLADLDRRQQVK
jgi:hypothetical protein